MVRTFLYVMSFGGCNVCWSTRRPTDHDYFLIANDRLDVFFHCDEKFYRIKVTDGEDEAYKIEYVECHSDPTSNEDYYKNSTIENKAGLELTFDSYEDY